MKASVIREFGDFDVLKYEEVPTPEPRPGHVLVKILAEAAEAHRLVAHNKVAGNIALSPWAEVEYTS